MSENVIYQLDIFTKCKNHYNYLPEELKSSVFKNYSDYYYEKKSCLDQLDIKAHMTTHMAKKI